MTSEERTRKSTETRAKLIKEAVSSDKVYDILDEAEKQEDQVKKFGEKIEILMKKSKKRQVKKDSSLKVFECVETNTCNNIANYPNKNSKDNQMEH